MMRIITVRSALVVAAVLVFAASGAVSLMVIPSVRSDPLATVDTAIPAFWANVGMDAFAGIAMLVGQLLPRRSGTMLLAVGGVVALVLGLSLLDAADAFGRHGPSMRGVTVTLFACAVADLCAAGIASCAAVRRARRPPSAEGLSLP